jgi:hypothetical protein
LTVDPNDVCNGAIGAGSAKPAVMVPVMWRVTRKLRNEPTATEPECWNEPKQKPDFRHGFGIGDCADGDGWLKFANGKTPICPIIERY